MPKRYWWVIGTYVIMQLTGLLAGVIFVSSGMSDMERTQASVTWSLISFIGALIIMLILLRTDMANRRMAKDRSSVDGAVLWAFLGIFIAFGAQIVSGLIEQALGVQRGSENTEMITEISRRMPIFIVVVAIIGPIMEEIVFRKVIFGRLYKKFDFAIAAIISSLLFGLAHVELVHLLTYTSMGFVFAFLYAKTKRILVPIVAHASMNTFVVLMQVIFADEIQKYMKHIKETQQLIIQIFS
ncbi:MAG TPA: type II CAAX endopeptidase family protein [Bacillales bacterium]|nr:type II CAAX endopeptidase family protein [Bacillales bacterium]